MDDNESGYRWLRKQYIEEHGSAEGWEAYCRELGIVSRKAERRYWQREPTTSHIEYIGVEHCPECLKRATVESNTVE